MLNVTNLISNQKDIAERQTGRVKNSIDNFHEQKQRTEGIWKQFERKSSKNQYKEENIQMICASVTKIYVG